MKDEQGLTPRQAAFVEEFLLCGNATKAAAKAGYSEKTANEQGSRLLANVNVQRAIELGWQARKEKFQITEEMIVKELAAIAFGHLGKVATWGSESMRAIPKEDMDPEAMKYLESIEKIQLGEDSSKVVVKTLSGQKTKALELLGKHIGMWSNNDLRSASSADPLQTIAERISGYIQRSPEGGGSGESA